MTDVREILTEAHAEIGVLGAGETMSAIQAAYGLQKLNELIDEWGTQNLTILSITRTTFPIVSGTGTYTIGPTGSVVMARPIFVPRVTFVDTTQPNSPEFPLIPLDDQAYEQITFKTLQNSLPYAYYWQNTNINATLIFYMTPNRSGLNGVIYAKTALTQYADINTVFDLPPGYRSALVKNTAMAMCPGYGAKANPLLLAGASLSLGNIKRANYRISQLTIDPAVTVGNGHGLYNIYTDTFR
jgi:hypothetical protein